MRATVTFSGLNVWQMGRLIRAAERARGLPDPVVTLVSSVGLWLIDNGTNRIHVIKAIREVTGLGLKEAKDMSEALPSLVLASVSPEKIRRLRETFDAAGAMIEFRDVAKVEG